MPNQSSYQRNKEQIKTHNKEYYLKNKEKINKRNNEKYRLLSPEELEKVKEYKKEYYKKNKEVAKALAKERYYKKRKEILASQKEYAKENPHQIRLNAARTRANKDNLPFDLDLDYLKSLPLPEICPILGIVMDGSSKEKRITLDKVVPSLGYVKGNVCFISGRANLLKNDASIEEVRKILAYMESFVLS